MYECGLECDSVDELMMKVIGKSFDAVEFVIYLIEKYIKFYDF